VPLAADFLVTTKYLDITLPFHLVQKLFSLTILTVDPCDNFHKDCRYSPSGQVAESTGRYVSRHPVDTNCMLALGFALYC